MQGAGGRIPIVPQERRQAILALPPTPSFHRDLFSHMPFATAVEVVDAAPRDTRKTAALPGSVTRVMAWNAARCTDVDASARLIQASTADIILLTEMDWGMARSGQVHTARELASRLSRGYAYAVEFLELGLGDDRERAAHAGALNEVGYHGAAILSDRPLSRARRVALEESGGWFDATRGQRRVGGRMALCASAMVGGGQIIFCAVHLESESDPSERSREMRILFDALDAAWPGLPVVIGGDLNTFSISKEELDHPSSVRDREAESPGRFADPIDHEPLFALAEERGCDWKQSNVAGTPTHHEIESAGGHQPMKIDWFLTRGVRVRDPAVLPAVDPGSRDALSDHDAIVVTIDAEGSSDQKAARRPSHGSAPAAGL